MVLKGKIAIITGGSGNLGQAVTRAFLDAGARIMVPAVNEQDRAAFVERTPAGPGELDTRVVNLTDDQSVARLVDDTVEKFGGLDALVHLVGGFLSGPSVGELNLEQWQGQLDLNLKTAFLAAKHCMPHLFRSRGSVVTVGARPGLRATGKMAAYGVAKAGLIHLTQTLAEEGKEHGMRANVIAPGVIDTPANRAAMPKSDPAAWVRPESIASVIVFLTSDAGRDVSGAVLPMFKKT